MDAAAPGEATIDPSHNTGVALVLPHDNQRIAAGLADPLGEAAAAHCVPGQELVLTRIGQEAEDLILPRWGPVRPKVHAVLGHFGAAGASLHGVRSFICRELLAGPSW